MRHARISVSLLLGSFFGAAMIAASFAYFNYKFAEYKFVNFKEWTFYEKSSIFQPKEDYYIVVFYSSKVAGTYEKLRDANASYPVLAIDYYQQSFENSKNTQSLRAGTNTNLKLIQRFNIYHIPTVFIIKKVKDSLYKQDSMIHKLDTLDKISTKLQEF